MATRNFYVKGMVDGRQTEITGGPTARDGGMRLYLTQRDDGSISDKDIVIDCFAKDDGTLVTQVIANSSIVYEQVTKR